MFDYSKLKGRMREKGVTQEEIADSIGMNKSTLSLKLNNQFPFVQDEINKLINILDIPADRIKDYFFIEKV